ncbi:RING/U-box superfamily protein [Perilla frutescens var. hirtella]|uniref:RING-type E3 ubiquitin transferase n=1 Tax=Perilla frutescens var. hirtella TaxID=608512 RepID=A0AAD4IN35_PERFH|nr:RING/U-box superfamily protein [Perilla frutescens var. hirtella]
MGISFSTTTPRRRAPTHPYPPPLHPYPADYYPPYPVHPSPYPVHPPPSPVYYPYYNSNAYTVCNHATPLVGHPYFGPYELPPPPPPDGEQKKAKVVNSDVNVHKDTLRLESDDLNPDRCVVSFVFDALLDGNITIYYFAKEEADSRVVTLFPDTYVPIKVPFRKGLHQEFRQPSGTGIDLRFFAADDLSNPSSRDDVFPIVISADTCLSPYIVDDRSYLLAHTLPQMQITQAVLVRSHEGQFIPKVVRQILWTDDTCYELREIYGLGKSGPGFNDNASGKECVVCMTEPKDIALLPCRHMWFWMLKLPMNLDFRLSHPINCAKTLRLQSNKCPICREIIEAVLEIRIDDMDH